VAHDATEGSLMFGAETETDWAINAQADGIDRGCVRSFFDFDLSSIPAGAQCASCRLTLQSYGANTCSASIQEGTQNDPLTIFDYDAFSGLCFNTQTWVIGENVFEMNVAGLIYLTSKFGNTAKLCMREYNHDYLDIEPGEGEILQAGLYWSGTAVAEDRPKITITYTY